MNLLKNTKLLFVALLSLSPLLQAKAQTFAGKQIKFNIFSSTPIEDIKAVSYTGVAVLVAQKQELSMQLMIKSFEFDKKLMQEHFNENYMESDKYPLAKFKGIIEPKIDWTKDGEYNVTAKGTLLVHGVSQGRTINGKITIKNKIVSLDATFNVACAAHQIKIPSLMFTKIAETIQVKVQGNLNPLN
ncbi:YceI family protein [Pedobacter insulae]|uniref:YceI-like domain-containing protein n=1 Tax=Pedobacter insulae TaxID=414048 RepID=A0A1I2YWT9_9SPHI|nr:YceI family protein [Pedobacter insulae]SFH30074.1 YceI-like domain-containing protein [Pedobacter insulae]